MKRGAVAALCQPPAELAECNRSSFIKFANGFFDSECQEHARGLLING